jgi:endonuclease/exonuclease/phosphatase family metal-dependent hydrolase
VTPNSSDKPGYYRGTRTIRVVTLNLWSASSDVERRIGLAIHGLKALSPDIVTLQEVVGETATFENHAALIARALDARWHFDPVGPRPDQPQVGNAIVSRFPIESHGSILLPSPPGDPRRALMCHVKTPYGVLPILSTHLSWEMWHAEWREKQVVVLDEFVRAKPAELPPIIGGDFNTAPDSAAIMFLTGRMSLLGRSTYYRDCWQRHHPFERGATWSTKNPYTVRWIERNRRLDYLFVGQIRDDGWGAVIDSRVIFDIPGPDGIFPSDHFGVYAEIGEAPAETAV